MRYVFLAVLTSVSLAIALGSPAGVIADPSIGVDGPSTSSPPLMPGDIFEPAPGAPVGGPLPLPVPVIGGAALGLPPGAEVDAISYGDDPFPPPAPWHLMFSVDGFSVGHPGSPLPPPGAQPNVYLEGPLTPPGDASVQGDLYHSIDSTFSTTALGAFSPAGPGPAAAPCVILSNLQAADEDGLPPFATGVPNVGLGLIDSPPGPAPGDNLDALDIGDSTIVDMLPVGGDGVPDAPVFFSVDPPTAGLLGVTPSDVLVWDPVTLAGYVWLPGGLLTLGPGDDLDALAVSYVSGAPVAGGPGPGDALLFSLTPPSPALSLLGNACGGASPPGPDPLDGTGGDIYFAIPAVAGPAGAITAEQLGLSTVRSGGPADDNVDAIDICIASGMDVPDLDSIDNACDFDDDNDLVGDSIDNCALLFNPAQTNTDGAALDNGPNLAGDDATIVNGGDATGDVCDADDDNDGLTDASETAGPPCASASAATDPLDMDSDGDHLTDGWECANGSDPADATSKFLGAVLGDNDGDNIEDLWELRGYNGSGGNTDVDADGCWDMVEIGSVDGNLNVGITDRLAVARRSLNIAPYDVPNAPQDYVFDIDKNGSVGIADRLFVARASLLGAPWLPKSC